ncbi:MAG: rhodanese-like domain-containing protein [Flavobacteriales bacterium]|jgi:phage shock protein E
MNMKELIQSPSTVIIDVRTPEEFVGGHVAGSKNIPLMEISQRVDELRAIGGDIVLCCASGNRSGHATHFLKNEGFTNVHNGGSWLDVNYYKSK